MYQSVQRFPSRMIQPRSRRSRSQAVGPPPANSGRSDGGPKSTSSAGNGSLPRPTAASSKRATTHESRNCNSIGLTSGQFGESRIRLGGRPRTACRLLGRSPRNRKRVEYIRVPCGAGSKRRSVCRRVAWMAGWCSDPECPGFQPGLLGSARHFHKKPPAEAGGLRVTDLPACHARRSETAATGGIRRSETAAPGRAHSTVRDRRSREKKIFCLAGRAWAPG